MNKFILLCARFSLSLHPMMRRLYFTALLLALWCTAAWAQDDDSAGKVKFPGGKCWLYRITLSDKNGTPYQIDHPEAFLSQKAIDRRIRQGLAIDSTDLPLPPAYLEQISATGAEIKCLSKWNRTVLVRVKNNKILHAVERLPFVAGTMKLWTSPDSVKPPVRSFFHKDFSPWEEETDNPYGRAAMQINLVNGASLHKSGYRGRGLTIAVFDGGFMNVDRIPAMQKINILGTRDFVAFPSKDIFQEIDHGTKVLSTMAVDEPGMFVGTAPEAAFYLCRTEDANTESRAEEDYWAAAAEFADSAGVDIINSSLGYHDFNDPATNYTYDDLDGKTSLVSRTASRLAGKGMLLVNSAGNDGMGTWKLIGVPADADDILTVGAVNGQKQNAAFSSLGPSFDGRVKPDVMGLGSPAAVVTGRGTIINDMGTSFASPVMAGMVACLWQALSDKTALQIIQIVRRSGNRFDRPNNVFGYGIPDFEKALQMGRKD